MESFTFREGQLFVEEVPVTSIAKQVGTPCYIYSRAMIEHQFHAFDQTFSGRDHLICYAVKANPNLAILNLLAQQGSGFDIVSVGELERVLAASGEPTKIVFSGVGKTTEELRRGLEAGIYCFNVESKEELERLNTVACAAGCRAPLALRINPDIDAGSHPYIVTGLKENKFGVHIDEALGVYQRAQSLPGIEIIGVASHIGSQLTEIDPFLDALQRLIYLVGELSDVGIELRHIDLGGGFGVRYADEQPPEPDDFVMALIDNFQSMGSRYQRLRLVIEPGRAIVAAAGILLTRVQYLKLNPAKNFAIVDAAMNDLMRPVLYDAWHHITPVAVDDHKPLRLYDIVGPVCESGDFLGRDRELRIVSDDLLAVSTTGAYGASMSSNYNSRPRAPEVMVEGDRYHIVRRRESILEMMQTEVILPK